MCVCVTEVYSWHPKKEQFIGYMVISEWALVYGILVELLFSMILF